MDFHGYNGYYKKVAAAKKIIATCSFFMKKMNKQYTTAETYLLFPFSVQSYADILI